MLYKQHYLTIQMRIEMWAPQLPFQSALLVVLGTNPYKYEYN